ncbi:hypothetical protein ACVIF9_001182 [Bradyrhizobium sp. USDA 4350]
MAAYHIDRPPSALVSAASAIRWQAARKRLATSLPNSSEGSQVAAHRGEVPINSGSCGGDARHHACRAAGPVKETWRICGRRLALALFPAQENHTQKRQHMPPNNGRGDVNLAREDWLEWQLDLDPERLVFIDETAANTKNCAPLRSLAPGRAMPCCRPAWTLENDNLHCWMRSGGSCCAVVLDGPVDGDAFLAYVEQLLAPSLRPGDTRHHGQLAPS